MVQSWSSNKRLVINKREIFLRSIVTKWTHWAHKLVFMHFGSLNVHFWAFVSLEECRLVFFQKMGGYIGSVMDFLYSVKFTEYRKFYSFPK